MVEDLHAELLHVNPAYLPASRRKAPRARIPPNFELGFICGVKKILEHFNANFPTAKVFKVAREVLNSGRMKYGVHANTLTSRWN